MVLANISISFYCNILLAIFTSHRFALSDFVVISYLCNYLEYTVITNSNETTKWTQTVINLNNPSSIFVLAVVLRAFARKDMSITEWPCVSISVIGFNASYAAEMLFQWS